jgi:hypothetical protein
VSVAASFRHVLGLEIGVEAGDVGDALGTDALAGVEPHAFDQRIGQLQAQAIENFRGGWDRQRGRFHVGATSVDGQPRILL